MKPGDLVRVKRSTSKLAGDIFVLQWIGCLMIIQETAKPNRLHDDEGNYLNECKVKFVAPRSDGTMPERTSGWNGDLWFPTNCLELV